VLRHGSLVRTVLEGRLPGKKGRGRPKEMLLSWLLETSDRDMDYSQLKKLAQELTRWCWWKRKPAQRAEYHRIVVSYNILSMVSIQCNAHNVYNQGCKNVFFLKNPKNPTWWVFWGFISFPHCSIYVTRSTTPNISSFHSNAFDDQFNLKSPWSLHGRVTMTKWKKKIFYADFFHKTSTETSTLQ